MTLRRLIATFATALVLVTRGLGSAQRTSPQTRCSRGRPPGGRAAAAVRRGAAPRRPARRRSRTRPSAPPRSTRLGAHDGERGRHPGARRTRLRQRAAARSRRRCKVGWTTLAGIGWVESQHGTIGGRTLGDDGHSSTPVLGPALDGDGQFAAIPATPRVAGWHGDPEWDHAVGPLQFIPSTWETWGADGDGDGVADPNDLDDAAFAAARYLCADGHDLTTGAGWADAVFGYNHSAPYVDSVYAAATAYASRAGR